MNITTTILFMWLCICIYIDSMIAMLLIEVEPEASPFVEDTVTEPRQQGKQPPFDHVVKNPIPSLSLMHD